MSIQFEQTCFKELIEKYPDGNSLTSYLESEEGGLFRVVDRDEEGLCLIRYEKGSSSMNLPHSKWFRSVVWNVKMNLPVCVAPPKASETELPFSSTGNLSKMGVVCQELLDGFMINCFRIAGDPKLYITSRSKLNAAGRFYSSKSFRRLFIEAYLQLPVASDEEAEQFIQNLGTDLEGPANDDSAVFYSFLVQHVEHRIVTPITSNRAYLIHKGIVSNNGSIRMEDGIATFRNKPNIDFIPLHSLLIPTSYSQVVSTLAISTTTTLSMLIGQVCSLKSWEFQGLVLKDFLGNRWRFRSEKYSAVKSLRGNSPMITDRYTQLYTQNLVSTYLQYYPEDTFFFSFHASTIHRVCTSIYEYYVALHITKVMTPAEIDKMYLPHLYAIHGIYLSQLRAQKKKVTMNEITQYFHKQPWQRIVFLIKKVESSYFSELGRVLQSDPMNALFE